MKKRHSIEIALISLSLILLLVLPVSAVVNGHRHLVAFSDIEIPVHTVVKHVVIVGGNADIAGTVTDEVVVFSGNVQLKPTARISDRVVVIGGNVSAADGARVGKGIFRIGGDFLGASSLVMAGLLILLFWLINITATIVLSLIPVALASVWGSLVEELSGFLRGRLLKCTLVGMLGYVFALIVSSILALSVIGSPVAILVCLLTVLATLLGFSGLCSLVGNYISLNWSVENNQTFLSTLYGAGFLALAINMPLLGFFILILSATASLGVVIIKVFKR